MKLFEYSPWSFMDLLSSHQGFRKRYELIYVDRKDFDTLELKKTVSTGIKKL